MYHNIDPNSPKLTLPSFPDTKIAPTISDSVANSQSFRFGNRNPQQRKRMRDDFNQNILSVIDNNFQQTPTQKVIDAQTEQILSNLQRYFKTDSREELYDFLDDDTDDWKDALNDIIVNSFKTRDVSADIKYFKYVIDYYVFQKDVIRAVNKGYRFYVMRWKITGLVSLAALVALFWFVF